MSQTKILQKIFWHATRYRLFWISGSSNEPIGGKLVFTPGGQQIIAGREGYRPSLWNISDATLVRTFSGDSSEQRQSNSFALSPDGTKIVSGGTGNGIGRVWLWNMADGALLRTLTGHTGAVRSVAFSPTVLELIGGPLRFYPCLHPSS